MVDKKSPLPLYYQIEKSVKERIERGELSEGAMIPSEREYAEIYKISRMTVRQAITNLVNDGYLVRYKGKGTFVADKKIEQRMIGLTSFTEDMKARGMVPSTKLLSFQIVPADQKTASRLGIDEGAKVYEIHRIRLADAVPMAIETSWISTELLKGLDGTIAQRSLYKYVEGELGLKIHTAAQELEASVAREAESRLLGIAKGTAVLLITRTTQLSDGRVLELVQSVYRGDRYKFVMNLERR